MKSGFYIVLAWALLVCGTARSQDVAVKTNLFYDAFYTVNVGAEVGLAPKWTLDVSGNVNAWSLSHGRMWKHWMVQPEARYWLCDRFSGHFFAVHVHGGQYNLAGLKNDFQMFGTDFSGLSKYRYQGWFLGAGVGYGYAWVLGRHWNLEGEVGIGYAYSRYDRFRCAGCGKKIEKDAVHNYFGPTKLAVNLVYVF